MPRVYISTAQYIWHFNLFIVSMQLYFNLKFKNMKFGQEAFKQMTHGSLSIDLPNASMTFMHLCLLLRNSRWIFKKIFLLKHFVYFLVFGDVIFVLCVITKIIFVCLI
jgi:hypothetical protein